MEFERTTNLSAEEYGMAVSALADQVRVKAEDSPHWMDERGLAMDISSDHRLIECDHHHLDVCQLAHNDPEHESRSDEPTLQGMAWECLYRDVLTMIDESDETEGSDDE